jgi:hypothetical protein
MTVMHFASSTEARIHFASLLDAARDGRPATVQRGSARAAVVDAALLRDMLATQPRWKAQVVAEAGGFSIFLPGVPVAGDGGTFDEAVDDTIDALREYADDWADRLSKAPNHRDNWGLVLLIELSDDAELRTWLTSTQADTPSALPSA